MNRYILIILVTLIFISQTSASNIILTQGSVNVTLDDLDGFAYTIPDDKREGFFESVSRLEGTLSSILNMKQIIKYGVNENLIEKDEITLKVNLTMQNKYPERYTDYNMVKENKYAKIRHYTEIKETFNHVKIKLYKRFDSSDFDELAYEIYSANQTKYAEEKEIDFSYISLYYDIETEKNTKKILAQEILTKSLSNQDNFNKLFTEVESNNNYEVGTIKQYKFDIKNPNFSKLLFSLNKTGLIKKLVNINSRFFIINIKKIKQETQKSFEQVKEDIIKPLINEKGELYMGTLLDNLIKDKKIKKDEDVYLSIATRYTAK